MVDLSYESEGAGAVELANVIDAMAKTRKKKSACTAAVAPVIYEYYAQYIEYVY